MIIIDYKDTRPIYEQITEKFKTLILKGVLQPDEQMPSVRSLAMELSINPNTIQKAYAQLEWEGYIYPVKGRGNFVAGTEKLLEERKKSCIEKILMLSEEAAEYGISREEIISELQRYKPKTAGNEEEGKIND
ncbi:MAG: GntR family transcriptional regulator [Lachnospiraceae bacterium]|nr:GntR family transcriptional regulator [Lachnospiraceae bacterium]